MHPLEDPELPPPPPRTRGPGIPPMLGLQVPTLDTGRSKPRGGGHPLCRDQDESKAVPSQNKHPPTLVPLAGLSTLLPPTCFWLPAQEGLALGRKSPYPPVPSPHLVRIQGIPQHYKVLPTGIPCPDIGSNRSQVFFSPNWPILVPGISLLRVFSCLYILFSGEQCSPGTPLEVGRPVAI